MLADKQKGRFRAFLEDVLRVRVKPAENKSDDYGSGGILDDIEGDGVSISNLNGLSELNQFRTIASDRESQYKIYDEMANDSVIASALEMYADDATQYNTKGEIIWAESDNPDISKFANNLIDALNLNKYAWTHIYNLVKYGDVYLETFRDITNEDNRKMIAGDIVLDRRPVGSRMDEYVEMVPNPAEIFTLMEKGKIEGFIRAPINNQDANYFNSSLRIFDAMETTVYSPDKFIHIPLSGETSRFPDVFTLEYKGDKDVEAKEYTIVRGKSILHDLFKIYKEVRLMEDSILLNRVTRSSIIRIMQVEMGDAPKQQTREKLKRIKQLVEQKNYMDKNAGDYKSMAAPGPIDNIIYVPTKHGEGAITASTVGGDVDVKSIVDLDYFKNKLYGGLKIPKQFLGEDMEGSGLSSGTSLTKLDARYARTVKRIQNSYIEGITSLINLYALDRGLTDHVGNFTIKMVSPATVEDQERDETMDNHVNMISSILELIDTDYFKDGTKKDVLLHFIRNMLNEPEVADILDDDTAVEEQEAEGDEPSESGNFGGGGGFGGPDLGGSDFGDDFGGFDDEGPELDLGPEEPEMPDDNGGFGDFTSEE